MSNVLNWQLGREMEYPYDAAYPDQQFAFVFNINRCIGCQTCTMACKSTWTPSPKGQEYMWWNNVETKPYGGYPHHWDVKTLDLLEAGESRRAELGGQSEDLKAPYGKFNGKTFHSSKQPELSSDRKGEPSAGLPARGRRMVRVESLRGSSRRQREGREGSILQGRRKCCPSTRHGSFTSRAFAIIAPTPRASPHARATPSTNAPRTASC